MPAQVCLTSTGVLSDLCSQVTQALLPYCDEIMMLLLTNLASSDVQRDVKPALLGVLGDLALAIENQFEKCVALPGLIRLPCFSF
jgi:importin subunit beta-1